MATLKQRLHRKNSSGSYDTVYLETSASLVLMANGTTVEAAINGKAASSHNHAASNITSGTLGIARGGTGVTSLELLKTALGISNNSSAQIFAGTYIGNGTNQNAGQVSLTFNFAPILLIIYKGSKICHGEMTEGSTSYQGRMAAIGFPQGLTTSFADGLFYTGTGYSGNGKILAKRSNDGKTITWYHSGSYYEESDGLTYYYPDYGYNSSGITYSYFAIG